MKTSLPGYADFHDPLVRVLDVLTNHQSGVWVPTSKHLYSMIIRAAGYDPQNLHQYGDPALGWCMEGVSKPAGFQRRVVIAYKDLHSNRRVPLTVPGGHRNWALTPEGIVHAQVLKKRAQKNNMTSRFLNQRLKETKGGLLKKLQHTVQSRMRTSTHEMVDDHVQNCMLRLISRDALFSRLILGTPIQDHHIAQWAVRSAQRDARDDGSEPVVRAIYGFRPKKDYDKTESVMEPVTLESIIQRMEQGDSVGGMLDAKDPCSMAETVEDLLLFETIWSRLEQLLMARTAKGLEYLDILKLKMQGYALQEIADQYDITRNQASILLTKARTCIRESWGDLQVLIPRNISEKPRLAG